ncbi:MAG: cupin domain-containing protein [Gammaproteobacteria bacterium]|nr:cupin domain-containing protein [Gammaproteobacteria bacterium]
MKNKSNNPVFKHYLNETNYSKGWGAEYWLLNNENLCCKILTLEKDKQCSLHFHLDKEEIFFVIQGELLFTWIDTKIGHENQKILAKGDSVFVPRSMPHRFMGMSEELCISLEAGTHHEEQDSYRVFPGDSQRK